jgi:hypothetical protein
MAEQNMKSLTNRKTWQRALYMLLFAVILGLTRIVLIGLVLLQLIIVLFSGQANDRLLKLGQSLSTFVYQVLQFLTFNSDDQPYPFGPWPKGAPKK